MVVESSTAHLHLARDLAGSGLYTLWVGGAPEISADGYYKAGGHYLVLGTLLMTIHPCRFPWKELTVLPGECRAVSMTFTGGHNAI